ncbi:MAG: DUF4410 domain-containing protein [Planctomycetota bacterium]|nr:DUF4410 domain-containing protein [Planctomycetota bacterium]
MRGKAWILVGFFLLGASGCRAYYRLVQTPTVPLSRYTSIHLPPMESEAFIRSLPAQHQPKYSEVIASGESLMASTAWAYLSKRFSGAAEPGPGTLIVRTELTDFRPGNRALRFFFGGYGAGRAILIVTCRLFDAETGALVGMADAIAELRYGGQGGSVMRMFENCGAGIARFIFDYYE